MTTGRALIALALAAAGFMGPRLDAAVSAALEVRERTAVPGQPFLVNLTVRGLESLGDGTFDFPPHPAFERREYPVMRNELYRNDGQGMRHEVSFSKRYILVPRQPGTYRLGPGAFTLKGAVHRTGTVDVAVRAAAAAKPQARGRSLFDIFRNPFGDGDEEEAITISVEQAVSSAAPFVGEAFALYADLYADRPANFELAVQSARQTVPGFWIEPAGDDARVSGPEETARGGRTLFRYRRLVGVFSPTTAGSFVLPEIKVQVQVGMRRRVLVAPGPRVETRALPAAGRPADWGGAIGDFSLRLGSEYSNAACNLPLELVVRAAGRGHLAAVRALVARAAADEWRILAPTVGNGGERGEDGLSGERVFVYLAYPLKEGSLALPVFELPFYDPAAGAWRRAATASRRLTVTPAPRGDEAQPDRSLALGAQRLSAALDPGETPGGPGLVPPTLAGGLLGGAALLLGAALFVRRRVDRLDADPAARARAAAPRAALAGMARARAALAAGEPAAAVGAAERAVKDCLLGRLGRTGEVPLVAGLAALLAAAGAPPEDVGRAARFLENCAALRYAGGAQAEDARALLAEAGELIDLFGRAWKGGPR